MRFHVRLLRILLLIPAAFAAPLGAQSPAWGLVEDLRIGALDGSESLNDVNDVTVSPDGEVLYVVQRGVDAIWTYDARSGRRLGTIGRTGRGPGEFSTPPRVGWRADTLYAVDRINVRISLFEKEGELLRTVPVRTDLIPETRSSGLPLAYSSLGPVLESALGVLWVAQGIVTSSPIILADEQGFVRTLAVRDLRGTTTFVPLAQGGTVLPQPMSQRTHVAFDPGVNSLVVVHQPAGRDTPGTFQVVRRRLTGDTIYSRTYRYTPQRVTPAFSDSLLSADIPSSVNGEQLMGLRRQYLVIPEHHPPITDAIVDRDGAAWLRQEDTGAASIRWLILDPEGIVRANTTAPRDLRLLYVADGAAWGTVTGEFDESYIVRHRIEK